MLSNDVVGGHNLSDGQQSHHRCLDGVGPDEAPATTQFDDERHAADLQAPICSATLSNQANQNSNSANLFIKTEDAERRYRPQKYCAVCGDRAIACNFNAVTCESCKAFFRRNAFKEQRLKCLFNNRCVINRVTRRFCSKCRILKCFQIGMKREWILTDEQKQMKRVKIIQNKQLKKLSVASSYSGSPPVGPEAMAQDNALDGDGIQLEQLACSRRMSGSIGSRSDSSETAPRPQIEMKDATTSCPDEFELALSSGDPKLVHYCSLVPQCQYCFSKLAVNCELDEHSALQQSESLAYSGSREPSNQTGQGVDCYGAAAIACGEDHKRGAPDLVHLEQQNSSAEVEHQRTSSTCCYLEPVSTCHQQAAQFNQFVGQQSQLVVTTGLGNAEQSGPQMVDSLQIGYLMPNCSVVDGHQAKAEFCPQACPVQPCLCRKNI